MPISAQHPATVNITPKGFGIWQATAYRYRDEVIAVLADHAPDLREALEQVAADGWSHVILDDKVVASDRLTEPAISKKGRPLTPGIQANTQLRRQHPSRHATRHCHSARRVTNFVLTPTTPPDDHSKRSTFLPEARGAQSRDLLAPLGVSIKPA